MHDCSHSSSQLVFLSSQAAPHQSVSVFACFDRSLPTLSSLINNIAYAIVTVTLSTNGQCMRRVPIYSLIIVVATCAILLFMLFNSSSMLEIYMLIVLLIMIYILKVITKFSNFPTSCDGLFWLTFNSQMLTLFMIDQRQMFAWPYLRSEVRRARSRPNASTRFHFHLHKGKIYLNPRWLPVARAPALYLDYSEYSICLARSDDAYGSA